MHSKTIKFNLGSGAERGKKEILREVYKALEDKGYDPIDQIVGYLLSEDPTYITTYNNARSLILRIERDELLQDMLIEYIKK